MREKIPFRYINDAERHLTQFEDPACEAGRCDQIGNPNGFLITMFRNV